MILRTFATASLGKFKYRVVETFNAISLQMNEPNEIDIEELITLFLKDRTSEGLSRCLDEMATEVKKNKSEVYL